MRNKRRKGRVDSFAQAASGPEKAVREEHRQQARQKKTKNKVKVNKMKLTFTVIVVVMIAVVGVSVGNIFSLRAEQKELEKTRQELLSEKATLKEELENVNDIEYIEEQARMQLKLIKPGEILYILEEDAKKADKDGIEDGAKEN